MAVSFSREARVAASRNLLTSVGIGAVLAALVLFAGVTAQSGSHAGPPAAEAEPPSTTEFPAEVPGGQTVAPSATAPPQAAAPSSAAAAPSSFPTDDRGFLNSSARCDASQALVARGHTQRSLVVICAGTSSKFQYRGVRLSDNASLTAAAEQVSDDGVFVAERDGVTYRVSSAELVVSAGGKTLLRQPMLDFSAPGEASKVTSKAPTPPEASRPVG